MTLCHTRAEALRLLNRWLEAFGGSTYRGGKLCEPELEAETRALLAAPRPILLHVVFRQLLVQGMLATSAEGLKILIDSESSKAEQAVSIWHEVAHALGITDEATAETIAQKLAAACPEIVDLL